MLVTLPVYIYIYTRFAQIWEKIFWRAVTLYNLGEKKKKKDIDSGYAYILYTPPKFSQVYTHDVEIIIKSSKDLSAWSSRASVIDPVYSIALNSHESLKKFLCIVKFTTTSVLGKNWEKTWEIGV